MRSTNIMLKTNYQTRKIMEVINFDKCDGKQCGQGKKICGGKYLCPHNNLASKFPELIPQWHQNNINPIEDYLPGSSTKVWWKCVQSDCKCHEWENRIDKRTRGGEGCPFCSNRRLCLHNNLEAIYPELKVEWSDDNNPMNTYPPCSSEKVKWICFKSLCGCIHEWESIISNRTKKGYGCPYCSNPPKKVCFHTSLKFNHPELINEWSTDNNPMDTYSPSSNAKVKWVCSKEKCGCHVWEATINHRTSKKPRGCPFCVNHKLCIHNNLEVNYPELVNEWSDDNNPMNTYSYGSSAVVKWVCSKSLCECHVWESTIYSRTSANPTGCPYCANQKVCAHNNLEVIYPELKNEWHFSNNSMNTYAPFSNVEVKWICLKSKCGCHVWDAPISDRTSTKSTGCPFCSDHKSCIHYNLKTQFPEFEIEWDYINNPKPMSEYAPHSNKKVTWICKKNKAHVWMTQINLRTRKEQNGCPHCSKSRGYSKAQIKWIQSIEIEENITIQHALCSEGEYIINGVGKVDGYCKETNTVYEFEGDWWHGNPLIYDRNDINTTNKKSFGYLYDRTIDRETLIRDLGYNLVVKWETE